MKILFVSGNLCDGGAQRVIAVVSSKLAEWGHDVNLLLFARNEKEYPLSEKVKVTALRESYDEYQKMSSLDRISFIRKYLKETKPEVAVGFMEGGYALYLSSFGIKMKKVASFRIAPKVLWAKTGMRAAIDKLWFKSADAVVVQTNKQGVHIGEIDKKLGERSTVIANPVSEHALETKPQGDFGECRRFVMAGRLSAQKNYEMALRAFSAVSEEHPNITLDIFGKGGLEEKLQTLINDMGLADRVKLCGWTTDTAESYSHYDAYLMTSNYEGMPNALMEAMAVGLPCISTDCDTGPEDLIKDGKNGFLVPVGDDEALANKMLDLIMMSQDERIALGKAAHETMEKKFNSDAIAKKWLELFENIK